jgi:hypothetical protein
VQGYSEIAAARREIENLSGRGGRNEPGRLRAPNEVTPAAEQVISQIVAARDGRESPPNETGILLWKRLFDG